MNSCLPVGGGGGGSYHEDRFMDQDDQLLQFAIQQSLMEPGQQSSQQSEQQLSFSEALDSLASQQQANQTRYV